MRARQEIFPTGSLAGRMLILKSASLYRLSWPLSQGYELSLC